MPDPSDEAPDDIDVYQLAEQVAGGNPCSDAGAREIAQELLRLRDNPLHRALAAQNQKVGAARKIVETFYCSPNAANPYDRVTAWAMHVALVQLAEVLKRGGHG